MVRYPGILIPVFVIVLGLMITLPTIALAAPANDIFANAQLISGTGAGVVSDADISDASVHLEPGEPHLCGTTDLGSVWNRYVPQDTGLYQIDTLGSTASGLGADTIVEVFAGSDLTTLTRIGCNDDYDVPGNDVRNSMLTVPLHANVTYFIQVRHSSMNPGWLIDSLDINIGYSAPGTSTAPSSATVDINGGAAWANNASVNVSLSATDDIAITYFQIAESQAALDSAPKSIVSPTNSFSGSTSFTLTGGDADSKVIWVQLCDIQEQCAQASDTIGLDRTKPVISSAVQPASPDGDNGWYVSDVVVAFSCTESGSVMSGIATNTVAGTTLSSSGADQSATNSGTCVDNAGNTADLASVSGIDIDKAGPHSITFSINDGDRFLTGTEPSTVTCTAQDDTSGMNTCVVTGYTTAIGTHELVATATDIAGNESTDIISYEIWEDTTPPVINYEIAGTIGANGWYTSDVTVTWSVTDDESDISGMTNCGQTTVDQDTEITIVCEATSAGGEGSNSVTIKRDATAPSLNPVVEPNPVVQDGPAVADPNAFDAMSGVATSSCDPVDTGTVGDFQVQCSATDQAGNTAYASAIYTVDPKPIYRFTGFANPLLVDRIGYKTYFRLFGSSSRLQVIQAWYTSRILYPVRAGETVPLVFRITTQEGTPVTDLAIAEVSSVRLNCFTRSSASAPIDESSAGNAALENLGDGYYRINWQTESSYAGSCRQVQVYLGEGPDGNPTVHTANFLFRR